MLTNGRLPFVDQLLSEPTPDHLFHYTDSGGLIGISSSKQLWAGRAANMNDEKEQVLGVELAKLNINNWLNVRRPATPGVVALLERMAESIYETNRQIYTVSLSAHADVLSQWRAYTPRSGGVAIGLPGAHLRSAANDQAFYLARCLYDHEEQWRLVDELVQHHVLAYKLNCTSNPNKESEIAKESARQLAADVAQYGPLIKDPSFKEEGEWRLVSTPSHLGDPRLVFRPGETGLRVYLQFELLTEKHPTMDTGTSAGNPGVVVGPNVDSPSEQLAVQMLLFNSFGPGWWHTRTNSPYR